VKVYGTENVEDAIEQARQALDAGDNDEALRLLTYTVYDADHAQVDAIKHLAEEGRATAGLFSRWRWGDVIRLANMRVRQAA
jgi:hypothetical protein